jgi:cell wall-associated NlpC family hydrolase
MDFNDLIGIPFLDGGRDPKIGLDCWGAAREIYQRFGCELPDYRVSAMDTPAITGKMEQEQSKWEQVNYPLPIPCLVAIRLDDASWVNHVGVYVGEGKFIHAYLPTGVIVDRVNHWKSRIVGFYVPRCEND